MTFTLVGHVCRPLLEKRGGNISYLCRQNFVALLCLDSNQHPLDLEYRRKSNFQLHYACKIFAWILLLFLDDCCNIKIIASLSIVAQCLAHLIADVKVPSSNLTRNFSCDY